MRKNNLGSPLTLDDLGMDAVNYINNKFKSHNYKNKVLHMSWIINYTEKMSCTHNSPIGEHNNFMCSKDWPTHFPGWCGRIWIVYQKSLGTKLNNILETVHIHTGSGGYGNYSNTNFKLASPEEGYPLSWDVKIYEDDWRELKVCNQLLGNFPTYHKFIYTLEDQNEDS